MSAFTEYALWVQVAACLVVLTEAARRTDQLGLDSLVAYSAGVVGLAGAFIGGHLLVILMGPDVQTVDVSTLSAVWRTPKAAFGAFAGAAFGGVVVLRLLRKPTLRYADACVPAIALGYFLYRIGCLANGCESGTATALPWAVSGPNGPETHPVALYHALIGLSLYLGLVQISGGDGRVTFLALGGYGLLRFGVEFVRVESITWLGWNPGHWLSLLCVVVAIVGGWAFCGRRNEAAPSRAVHLKSANA